MSALLAVSWPVDLSFRMNELEFNEWFNKGSVSRTAFLIKAAFFLQSCLASKKKLHGFLFAYRFGEELDETGQDEEENESGESASSSSDDDLNNDDDMAVDHSCSSEGQVIVLQSSKGATYKLRDSRYVSNIVLYVIVLRFPVSQPPVIL